MRVLQVMTGLDPAGAERVVVDIVRGLKAAGHEARVVSLLPPPGSPIVDELSRLQVPVTSLGVTRSTPWRSLGLKRVIREFSPHIVHSHLFHANITARLCLPPRSMPLVNTEHAADRRPHKAWQFPAYRWTQNRCHVHTVVSGAVRDYLAPRVGRSPADLPVIHNGITPPPSVDPAEIRNLRREWGVEHCTTVLGSVGRLVPQKGYDRFLDLLPRLGELVPSGDRWGVVILGAGPEKNDLKRRAAAAEDRFDIRFPGFREDAARCAGAFDLFFMPSRFEGFGLTLAEAMAHGIPVLTSRVDSLPEVMEDYPRGRMVEFNPGDEDEVMSAIIDLLQSGNSPTPRVRFTVESMVSAYLDLYARLSRNGS